MSQYPAFPLSLFLDQMNNISIRNMEINQIQKIDKIIHWFAASNTAMVHKFDLCVIVKKNEIVL